MGLRDVFDKENDVTSHNLRGWLDLKLDWLMTTVRGADDGSPLEAALLCVLIDLIHGFACAG